MYNNQCIYLVFQYLFMYFSTYFIYLNLFIIFYFQESNTIVTTSKGILACDMLEYNRN